MKPLTTQSPKFYQSRVFSDWDALPFLTIEPEKLTLIKSISDIPYNPNTYYHVSRKLDGKNVRIIKHSGLIRFLTSGHLDFYHNEVASFMEHMPDGCYFCELTSGEGNIGDRTKLGYLTTAVKKYGEEDHDAGNWRDAHGVPIPIKFNIFDYVEYDKHSESYITHVSFHKRLSYLARSVEVNVFYQGDICSFISVVDGTGLVQGHKRFKALVDQYEGGNAEGSEEGNAEGLVFHDMALPFIEGKQVKHYKLKFIHEEVGKCWDIEYNKHGQIGTLLVNCKGGEAKVSSGINDEIRMIDRQTLFDSTVEFEYEYQTKDGKYSQCRLKRIISAKGKTIYE
jgi:hypothetical protein